MCIALIPGETLGQTDARPSADKAIGVEQVRQAVAGLPEALRTPDRYALVIGAGVYADDRVSDLPAAANDARTLRDVLTDPTIGLFPADQVTLLTGKDVTRRKVVAALDDLGRRAGADDLVIVFFSGHGATDERGRSYWVMADSRVDQLRATAVLESDISELLGEIKTKRLLLLIDACYSAATANLTQTKSLLDLKKVYPRFQGDGRVAITASKGDQLSVVITDRQHPGHGYSAFAWHAINGIKGRADADAGDRDGVVTVDELWDYVKDRTADTARRMGGDQLPQLKGQIGSKFLLTVDARRLARLQTETRQARELREKRLAKLRELALDEKITVEQYNQGRRLINTPAGELDAIERRRLAEFTAVADEELPAAKLARALELIETPAQRQARLAREAAERAERLRQSRIAELLATARANDSKANGRTALSALDSLLKLDPHHADAKRLRAKIAGYYGPSKVGDTITNSIGMKLTYIPAGEFLMGSPRNEEGRDDDETQHRVRISHAFLLGTTEVTQGQYRVVMGKSPSYFEGSDDLPVESVSWEDAVEFCRELGAKEGKTYRLPTESEWEYACRAGTTTAYSFGGDYSKLSEYGWWGYSSGNADKRTHPVGRKKPNGWGLYDMHGNVYEWCSDWYGAYPYNSVVDPAGASTGKYRVLRGGSWRFGLQRCRASSRYWNTPGDRYSSRGFRVVLDLD